MEGGKHKGILKATELAGEEPEKHNAKGIALPKATAKEVDFEHLFSKFKESLPRSSKALAYMKQRDLENFKNAGYNSGKFFNKLKHCIIFPLKDKEGNVCSLYGRRITESGGYNLEYGKHYYSENRSGLYPYYPNSETEQLILTEAVIDAATLLQIPEITSQFTVLSCYGNLAFIKEAQEAVKNLPKLQEVIIFFDGDQGGLDGIKHVTEILN
jgi:DNA primase